MIQETGGGEGAAHLGRDALLPLVEVRLGGHRHGVPGARVSDPAGNQQRKQSGIMMSSPQRRGPELSCPVTSGGVCVCVCLGGSSQAPGHEEEPPAAATDDQVVGDDQGVLIHAREGNDGPLVLQAVVAALAGGHHAQAGQGLYLVEPDANSTTIITITIVTITIIATTIIIVTIMIVAIIITITIIIMTITIIIIMTITITIIITITITIVTSSSRELLQHQGLEGAPEPSL